MPAQQPLFVMYYAAEYIYILDMNYGLPFLYIYTSSYIRIVYKHTIYMLGTVYRIWMVCASGVSYYGFR